MSINKAFISGNLTRDCDVRQTRNGIEIVSFSVAVNDRRKNQNGEWEDYPNYIDCSFFGSRAGKLSGYLVKGAKVSIEGKLRWSQWEKDGQKRSKIEVIVDEIEFLSRQESTQQAQYPYPSLQQHATQQQSFQSYYDEDIPF